jgi:DNA invertase Pin-like site-specific DNA recombinase
MGSGQRVGYKRASTADQSTDRQLDGLFLDRVFTEHASGKNTERPELQKLFAYVREGDTLVVHSMDRLARNLDDLRRLVRELTAKGVRIEFLKEAMTFTGDDAPMATLMLSMMGAFAEFERALIRERQREGVALAKARGAYKGRRRVLTGEQVEALQKRAVPGANKAALARELGIGRRTLYAYLRGVCVPPEAAFKGSGHPGERCGSYPDETRVSACMS